MQSLNFEAEMEKLQWAKDLFKPNVKRLNVKNIRVLYPVQLLQHWFLVDGPPAVNSAPTVSKIAK